MSKRIQVIAAILLSFLFLSCTQIKGRKSYPVTAEWKYALGDNMNWAKSDYDDSNWIKVKDNSITRILSYMEVFSCRYDKKKL